MNGILACLLVQVFSLRFLVCLRLLVHFGLFAICMGFFSLRSWDSSGREIEPFGRIYTRTVYTHILSILMYICAHLFLYSTIGGLAHCWHCSVLLFLSEGQLLIGTRCFHSLLNEDLRTIRTTATFGAKCALSSRWPSLGVGVTPRDGNVTTWSSQENTPRFKLGFLFSAMLGILGNACRNPKLKVSGILWLGLKNMYSLSMGKY